MFSNYFEPLTNDFVDFQSQLNKNQIGYKIDYYFDQSFPNIETAEIAFIFVPENRGGLQKAENPGCHLALRKSFYSLFKGNWNFRMIDFGNLKIGSEVKDTYFALTDIVSNLLSQSIFPVVIGGSNDLVYAVYLAYESFSRGVNLLCVDSKFDLIDADSLEITSRNFVGHIIKKDPNHLSNYINLGYQSYLCQNDESHLLEKMLFESCRLGDIRDNIKESEPYMRNADLVSFDLSAIKQADAPGTSHPSPNGLEAHHSCAISRYAGVSDKVSSFGIFELDMSNESTNQTLNLTSQIIWYFLEGFSLRVNDYPSAKTIKTNYKKYFIPIKDSDLQFIFYKSKLTGRWWVSSSMEFDKDTSYQEKIIPCSYDDYLNTLSGDIPSRIFRVLKSLS